MKIIKANLFVNKKVFSPHKVALRLFLVSLGGILFTGLLINCNSSYTISPVRTPIKLSQKANSCPPPSSISSQNLLPKNDLPAVPRSSLLKNLSIFSFFIHRKNTSFVLHEADSKVLKNEKLPLCITAIKDPLKLENLILQHNNQPYNLMQGITLLHAAARNGDLSLTAELLVYPPTSGFIHISIVSNGRTPLHGAFLGLELLVVNTTCHSLTAGWMAPVPLPAREEKENPIEKQNEYLTIIELLLDAGSDLLKFDLSGQIPLHIALRVAPRSLLKKLAQYLIYQSLTIEELSEALQPYKKVLPYAIPSTIVKMCLDYVGVQKRALLHKQYEAIKSLIVKLKEQNDGVSLAEMLDKRVTPLYAPLPGDEPTKKAGPISQCLSFLCLGDL